MKRLLKISAVSLAIICGSATTSAAAVDETKGTEFGVLSCTVEGGFGLLVGSSKKMDCEFTHTEGTIERYTGHIDKLGIDIGGTSKAFMEWLVFTPLGNNPGDYALEGKYVGISGEISLGIGLGANALIGGSNRKIGLQPVSVQSSTGLNLAVGLSSLTLNPVSE